MTKTHFAAIARVLDGDRACATESQRTVVKGIMYSLADYFASVNPRFDRKAFYSACGFGS